MKAITTLIAIAALAALTGCSAGQTRSEPPWPAATPTARAMDQVEPTKSSTSLWHSGAELTKAYDDHRARRIGDLVTVVVVESSEASREASTDLGRDTEVDFGIDTMLGAPDHLGLPDLYKGGNDFSPHVAASTSNSFSGGGSTKRKETLRTNVAARVIEILHDGNMIVEGRRQVEVNNDIQYIYVRGMARPVDISPNNTISSSSLADAEIVYNGTGAIANEQKPGWGYRFFSAIWPF